MAMTNETLPRKVSNRFQIISRARIFQGINFFSLVFPTFLHALPLPLPLHSSLPTISTPTSAPASSSYGLTYTTRLIPDNHFQAQSDEAACPICHCADGAADPPWNSLSSQFHGQ